jgi:type IV pilus assembly protein PilB
MYEAHDQAILEIFKESDLLTKNQLDELQLEHDRTAKPLADVILDSELIEKNPFFQAVADHLGMEYVSDPPKEVEKETVQVLQPSMARMYGVMPIAVSGGAMHALVIDPFNAQVTDDLTFALGKDVVLYVADPLRIREMIRDHYGEEDASVEDLLHEMEDTHFEIGEDASESDLEEAASQTPIIRFVNLVLSQAVRDQASDIHFEPFEDEFKIRYRIDGALYEMAPPPMSLAVPVTSRVKVIANLNISERRIPQDGRIKMTIAGHPVDLRVSTLPTQFGESVVLRVLDKSVVNLDLEALSMPDDVYEAVNEVIHLPNGIFIATGPTGSGKTTTLYSGLRKVNRVEKKILTAEDPVEYEIEGIMQVPVNSAVGLTFAKALRAFLRQDPDIIMVGEIRDLETAQIAIQASLTGHLVFSTLHTNDSSGAVTRLVDMGLEPYLMAASLEAVIAQRLVRRICKSCVASYEPSQSLISQLEIDPVEIGDKEFYYGKGCEDCNHSGYRGRLGLFEMLRISDGLRDLISDRAPALVLRQKALEEGMRTLRDDGLRNIFDGATTIEEVLKYT